jgi:hypothetical protein
LGGKSPITHESSCAPEAARQIIDIKGQKAVMAKLGGEACGGALPEDPLLRMRQHTQRDTLLLSGFGEGAA